MGIISMAPLVTPFESGTTFNTFFVTLQSDVQKYVRSCNQCGIIIIISKRANNSLHTLSISSNVCMKMIMGISAVGSYLLRIKLHFVFVRYVSFKIDISLKLNKGSNRFIKGANGYPQRAMGISDVKKFTAGIMKSGVIMEHPSGMAIKANGELTVLLSW